MELTAQNPRATPSNAQQVHLELDARITMISCHLVLVAVLVSIQQWVPMLAMTVGLVTCVLAMQLSQIRLF